MRYFLRALAGVFTLAFVVLGQDPLTESAAKLVSPIHPLYLYTHFRDNDTAHLRLSYSLTAVDWHEVNPQGSFKGLSMRDPSIMYVPGTETFYFIVTPPPGETKVQFLSSTDLVHFSKIKTIDMASYVPGAVTAWAPEWWHDPQDGKYYFFIAVSTDPQGRSSSTAKMSPYLVQFDPVAGEVTGSPEPVSLLHTTQGRTFDFFPYYDGHQYYLLYVDQQAGGTGGSVMQPIAYATSPTLQGPYTQQTRPGADYFGLGTLQSEAPTIIRMAQTDCVRIVFDTWVVAPPGVAMGSVTNGRKYTTVYRDSCTNSGSLFGQTSLVTGPSPLQIAPSEHGTIIALTDPQAASVVEKATRKTAAGSH